MIFIKVALKTQSCGRNWTVRLLKREKKANQMLIQIHQNMGALFRPFIHPESGLNLIRIDRFWDPLFGFKDLHFKSPLVGEIVY